MSLEFLKTKTTLSRAKMDFGEILRQWDDSCRSVTKSRSHSRDCKDGYKQVMKENSSNSVTKIEEWLNKHGIVDKDKLINEAALAMQLSDIGYIKSLPPDATLDLHLLTREEAWERLDAFVSDCCRRGLRKILIIHGKGIHSRDNNPILGQTVRIFIEQDKRLGASGHPDRKHGGNGATWVLIRSMESAPRQKANV